MTKVNLKIFHSETKAPQTGEDHKLLFEMLNKLSAFILFYADVKGKIHGVLWIKI